ncbi:hypothetical protein Tco_1075641 [Tanacetum coccineum]
MTTLAKHIIVVRAENHPTMLEKSMYDSWESRIRLFIKGKKHGRMMLDSIDNDCTTCLISLLMLGETLYEYYLRFSQLINDMHTIGMTMQQFQVNTKFLNALPSEWSKFVTDVKYPNPLALVANSLTLYNPSQSLQHSVSYQPFISPSVTQQSQAEFLQLDSSLVVPTFQQGEDPIESINKAMAFLSVVASWFPPSNNQLRTSSNPINQATIQDGRVIVQKVQGRQTQSYAGIGNRGMTTTLKGNFAAGQPRILDEEQLVFLADPDCDDLSSAKAVLMENLLSCDPEVLFKDTNSSAPNDLLVLSLVDQMTDHVAHLDKENKTNKMINESLTADLERYKERVTIFKQRLNVDLNKYEKLIDSQMDDLIRDRNAKLADFQQKIDTLKETLSNNVKEKESLSKTLNVFKT